MEMPEAKMPLHRPDWPWEIMIAIRIASSSDGKEYTASAIMTSTRSTHPPK